jgi:hypothetical protein
LDSQFPIDFYSRFVGIQLGQRSVGKVSRQIKIGKHVEKVMETRGFYPVRKPPPATHRIMFKSKFCMVRWNGSSLSDVVIFYGPLQIIITPDISGAWAFYRIKNICNWLLNIFKEYIFIMPLFFHIEQSLKDKVFSCPNLDLLLSDKTKHKSKIIFPWLFCKNNTLI